MHHLDARQHVEQLAGEMIAGASARGRQIDLARIGFVISNELRDGLGRHRGIDHHHLRLMYEACDRHEIAHHFEAELVVDRDVDRRRRTDRQQRVAIRGRAHHNLGGKVGRSARAVFDEDRLTEPLR